MLEQWLIEIMHALGRMLYTPLLYWTFILLIIAGARRIKRDRKNFGTKVFGLFSEQSRTILISLVFGTVISLVFVLFGFVLTWEIIIVLSIITILLSLNGSFQFLSASYTIGITFALVLILANISLPEQVTQWIQFDNISSMHFISLSILIGLLLLAEAIMIQTTKHTSTFPKLEQSNRGLWIGAHELKRMSIIPVLTFIPANEAAHVLPFYPFFELGTDTFQLVFVPFIIGIQYNIRGTKVVNALKYLTTYKMIHSFILIAFILVSLYFPIVSLLVVVLAILMNEWITLRYRTKEMNKAPYYAPSNEGLKVLAVIPKSRAEQLEILPGETIVSVNGKPIVNSIEYYAALQRSGAFVKLDIINLEGELKFVKSALYEEDHHDLGLIFPEAPIKLQQSIREKELRLIAK